MRYKAIKLCEYETAGQSPLSLETGGERLEERTHNTTGCEDILSLFPFPISSLNNHLLITGIFFPPQLDGFLE